MIIEKQVLSVVEFTNIEFKSFIRQNFNFGVRIDNEDNYVGYKKLKVRQIKG